MVINNFIAKGPREISLRSEFIKSFPPFLIYLGIAIVLLSFFKDLVRVGYHTSWLLIRVGYIPFILLTWYIALKTVIRTRFYEAPLWVAGVYITLLCTYFSLATGGLKSDYIYGLIQFYFAIAIMPVTAITFYFLSLTSISIYIILNVIYLKFSNLHDYAMISTLIPLLVFSAVVYFITSRVRHAKINLHNMLSKTLIEMDETIKVQSEKLAKIETREALSLLAVQMAHDIRSPLAALSLISEELAQLPETIRLTTQRAIIRINDIANNLLNRYKQCDNSTIDSITSELVADAIDSVISEKRIQIKGSKIDLMYRLSSDDQNIFARLHLVEFKRMISNLINNAIESIIDCGRVEVKIYSDRKYINISIKDTGCGISTERLKIMFQEGNTTKKEGCGLGLVHAKRIMNLLKGDIIIKSMASLGTTVSLKLPKCSTPEWFATELKLSPNSKIIIIDDDPSIHEIWETRFSELKPRFSIDIIHFSHLPQLKEWHENNSDLTALYLCDYEFVNSSQTGLEEIERLRIISSTYLVTSRYEDDEIRRRCVSLGLKIIPKRFSVSIPLVIC